MTWVARPGQAKAKATRRLFEMNQRYNYNSTKATIFVGNMAPQRPIATQAHNLHLTILSRPCYDVIFSALIKTTTLTIFFLALNAITLQLRNTHLLRKRQITPLHGRGFHAVTH